MSSVIQGNLQGSSAIEIGLRASLTKLGGAAVPPGFAASAERSASPNAPAAFELTRDEIRGFLDLITRSLLVKRHYELFQLVQGEVQDFIPHRILVSAWGDFDGGELTTDVISAIPGVRTHRLATCDIELLMRALHLRWLAHGRQPLLLRNAVGKLFAESTCRCTLHAALQGMGAALVHGNHDARGGSDSLYLALNTGPITKTGEGVERFRFLADLIISQLDVAFRKVAALKRHGESGTRGAQRRGGLSLREEEIIDWVAKGRTNAEISGVLSISEYTVKNHVRRIMKKLGAANRTEAVAKFHRGARDPRARVGREGTPVTANRG